MWDGYTQCNFYILLLVDLLDFLGKAEQKNYSTLKTYTTHQTEKKCLVHYAIIVRNGWLWCGGCEVVVIVQYVYQICFASRELEMWTFLHAWIEPFYLKQARQIKLVQWSQSSSWSLWWWEK